MASEKINVKIEADYDDREAKQALKDAERLDGTEAVVTIDAESDDAVRAIREVDEALEDVPSKADKVAAAIVEMANKIDAETRDAAAAADMLKVALGDAAERIDATEAVAELRKMGLTADEVRADVDQLADALRHADELELSRAKGELDSLGTTAGATRTKVKDLGDSSDQSRSVLANMAGNAAQDLGEIGGVVGTLGVGIGQLAEYATEGNISMGALAKVAGPMAALAGASLLVSKYIGEAGAEAAKHAERVKTYAKAIEDLGVGSEAAATGLQEMAAAVAPATPSMLDKLGTAAGLLSDDLVGLFTLRDAPAGWETVNEGIASLTQMGFSIEQIGPLLTGSRAGLDAFLDSLEMLPEAEGHTAAATKFLTEQWEAYAAAQQMATDNSAFFARSAYEINTSLDDQAAKLRTQETLWNAVLTDLADGTLEADNAVNAYRQLQTELGLTNDEMDDLVNQKLADSMKVLADESAAAATSTRDTAEAAGEAADALNAEADAADAVADALSEQADAQRRAVDAYYNLRDARQSQVAAIEAVKTAEDEHGTESVEYREALEDVTAAVDDTAQAEVRLATEQAESEGATLSAVDAIDIQNSALIRQASQLRGPSRAAIVQHIAALNGIPPEVVSEILALLDEGKVEEAEAKITELSAPRELEVQAEITKQSAKQLRADADALTADRSMSVKVALNTDEAMRRIAALIEAIRNARNLAAAVPKSFGASSRSAPAVEAAAAPTNVYVNVPRGVRPDDMIRAGDRYARRNGHARAHRR